MAKLVRLFTALAIVRSTRGATAAQDECPSKLADQPPDANSANCARPHQSLSDPAGDPPIDESDDSLSGAQPSSVRSVNEILERLSREEPEAYVDAPDPDGTVAQALALMERAYPQNAVSRIRGVEARDTAKREILEAVGNSHPATYGEMAPNVVAGLLHKIGASPGQRFVDFGSGIGKPAAMAWLLGLEAVGVELVSLRWKVSCEIMQKFRSMPASEIPSNHRSGASLTFVRGSFLQMDFAHADILFANSVSFTASLMHGLAHAARRMKPGSIIITAKRPRLTGPGFRFVKNIIGPTSWALDSVWSVYAVEAAARSTTLDNASNEHAPSLKTLNEVAETDKCIVANNAPAPILQVHTSK